MIALFSICPVLHVSLWMFVSFWQRAIKSQNKKGVVHNEHMLVLSYGMLIVLLFIVWFCV